MSAQGSGDGRHLVIGCEDSVAAPIASREAKALWAVAQDVGGKFWEMSQNEIQQRMDSCTVPYELLEMVQRR